MNAHSRYLVELERPDDGWMALQGVSRRAREATLAVCEDGDPVRFLRTVYVPEDDTCFFLFEAETADAVIAVGEIAGVAFHLVAQPVADRPGFRRAVLPLLTG